MHLNFKQCYRHNTFTTILSCLAFISSHLDPLLILFYYLLFRVWHLSIIVKLLWNCCVRSFIDFLSLILIQYFFLLIFVATRLSFPSRCNSNFSSFVYTKKWSRLRSTNKLCILCNMCVKFEYTNVYLGTHMWVMELIESNFFFFYIKLVKSMLKKGLNILLISNVY